MRNSIGIWSAAALAIFAAGLGAAAQQYSTADRTPKTSPFGPVAEWAAECESPCLLPEAFTRGGYIAHFMGAADQLRGKELIIDSDVCASSCTHLLDVLYYRGERACATSRTEMWLHYGTADGVSFMAPEYSSRLLTWYIRENPGFIPNDGTFRTLKHKAGWEFFWPACKEEWK